MTLHSAHFIRHEQSAIPSEGSRSVSVHGGPLRVAAELPVCGGADGPAATRVATGGAALLQSQKLLGTEGLVVNLAGGLDQILQVRASQEVAQVDKLAVVLILHIDNTPAVLTAANLLAVDYDGLLTADNREGDNVLHTMSDLPPQNTSRGLAYLDLSIDGSLLIVELVVIVGVHLQVVESKLLLDPLLECLALFEGEGVGLGDDGNDVDNVRQLLQNNDIDGLETAW